MKNENKNETRKTWKTNIITGVQKNSENISENLKELHKFDDFSIFLIWICWDIFGYLEKIIFYIKTYSTLVQKLHNILIKTLHGFSLLGPTCPGHLQCIEMQKWFLLTLQIYFTEKNWAKIENLPKTIEIMLVTLKYFFA